VAVYLSRFFRLMDTFLHGLAVLSVSVDTVCQASGRFHNWHMGMARRQDSGILNGSSGIQPMSTILIGMQKGSEVLPSRPIQARWKGHNLAVHAAMVHRSDIEDVGPMTKESAGFFRWRVTHLATGFSGAKFMHLSDALKVAKLFDSLFSSNTKEEIKENTELVEMFTSEVIKNGGRLT
jgi:hypothetical protein